ncbi:hypothetical protein BJ684DRAFT_21903, partial [Piptocephalis cylindrospora]
MASPAKDTSSGYPQVIAVNQTKDPSSSSSSASSHNDSDSDHDDEWIQGNTDDSEGDKDDYPEDSEYDEEEERPKKRKKASRVTLIKRSRVDLGSKAMGEVEEAEEAEEDPYIHITDDGSENRFKHRLEKWLQDRYKDIPRPPSLSAPYALSHPEKDDARIDERYRLPGDLHERLFDYQRVCVQWLWELHLQRAGGILGDEM